MIRITIDASLRSKYHHHRMQSHNSSVITFFFENGLLTASSTIGTCISSITSPKRARSTNVFIIEYERRRLFKVILITRTCAMHTYVSYNICSYITDVIIVITESHRFVVYRSGQPCIGLLSAFYSRFQGSLLLFRMLPPLRSSSTILDGRWSLVSVFTASPMWTLYRRCIRSKYSVEISKDSGIRSRMPWIIIFFHYISSSESYDVMNDEPQINCFFFFYS